MNIKAIKEHLADRYPPFADIIDNTEFINSRYVVTSGNNAGAILYNGYIMDSFTEAEQEFFIARELMHIALDHNRRGKKKDNVLWEKATNSVVAAMLRDDGFAIPSSILIAPEAENADAESMYAILAEAEGKTGPDENDDEPEDEPDDTPQAVRFSLKEGEALEEIDPDLAEDGSMSIHGDAQGDSRYIKPGKETKSRAKKLRKIGLAEELAGLKDYLEGSVNRDFDWFPGDTVRNGMVRDVFKGYPVPQAEILIDTSMSVNDTLLKTFLRVCKSLLKDAVIKVGCFDTKFYGFKEIETEKDIDDMHFQGFGGTDFNVALEAFTGDAENKIIFTDGYAEMPEKRSDVIWVVYGTMDIAPKGGTVIYVNRKKNGGNSNAVHAS